MHRFVIGIIVCLFVFTACQRKPTGQVNQIDLLEQKGIFVEQFDSANNDENRYTANNLTYKSGTQFTYAYSHLSPQGQLFFFDQDNTVEDYRFAWKFVKPDSVSSLTYKKIRMTVQHGLKPFSESLPDYKQTIIRYDYYNEADSSLFNSLTGLIENEKNTWIHPPRSKYFRILELNPFPYIQAPFQIGNSWDWSLTIGSHYGDRRWLSWEGNIENNCHYQIVDREWVTSQLGQIECWVVEAKATSVLGETQLNAYYHEKYGFVSLRYLNIDGSITTLELIDYLGF